MNKPKLRKLSITLSVVAWFIFGAICLVPMSEGGLAALACLVMIGVFTAIVALDIFGTFALGKPRMGCRGVLYFVAWSLVLAHSSLLTVFCLSTLEDVGALVFAIVAAFALAKILIGRALRRSMNETEKIHQSPTFSAQSVQTHFVILAVTWWIGFPLSIIGEFLPEASQILIGLIWLPALIVTTVFWFILLYRQWSLLQGHGARVTPGKAVGFGFIPFYCFYWWFVAYAGLATDTNKYLRNAGINSKHMSFGLAVTDCIISILACTIGLSHKVGAILIIPSMIIGFILVVQQRDCVLAILKERTEKLQPATAPYSEPAARSPQG